MNKYRHFFVLGSHPAISAAEILAYARTQDIRPHAVRASHEILIFETEHDLDLAEWQRQLGGCIKSGIITTSISRGALDAAFIAEQYREHGVFSGKNILGMSPYSLMGVAPRIDRRLPMHVKAALRDQGISVRMITNEGKPLTSVQVTTQKILTKGAEIVCIADNGNIYVGFTHFVQDFEEFGERDYGRPGRDSRSGMLPPKLARMMINLSGATTDAILLDPFCGSGTVLTEAMEMGISNIIGSDISERAISDSKENIAWMREYLQAQGHMSILVQTHDATKPFMHRPVTHVVSELYLGPAHMPNGKQFEQMVHEIEKLLTETLTQLHTIVQPGGKAILAIPMFRRGANWQFLDSTSAIQKSGFVREQPLPTDLMKLFHDDLTTNNNLGYARKDATVGRELLQLSR